MNRCLFALVVLSFLAAPIVLRGEGTVDDEYNEKLKNADNFSADSQYQLSLWCEEKGLAERAEEHLLNAFTLDSKHAGASAKVQETLKTKTDKLAADDANGCFEVGLWCIKAGMKDEATKLFEKAIGIDPNHTAAREKLGFVKLGDKWVTVEEARTLQGGTGDAVEAIGKALAIEFKKPFINKAAGPYMLYFQREGTSAEFALDAYVDAFTWYYEGVKEKFGDVLGLPPKDRVITVAIIENGEAMSEYLKRKGEPKAMSIHYERDTKRLLLRAAQDAKDALQSVAHEGSHQFYYEAMNDTSAQTSLWVQEGISCFTEAFKRNPETLKWEFGTMNERLIYKIKKVVKENKQIPLAEFVELKYEDWVKELKDMWVTVEKLRETGEILDQGPEKEKQRKDQDEALERKRQQGWSLFYFLYYFGDGKYRSKLLDYLKLETTTGRSGLAPFKEIFGDPAAIEKEWLEYVPTMSAMD
ncbi:MAG: hypothetical protein RDV41_12845 [Planctomycetota bacterium]|nr:hypothetical protein [Planctomycetota bacterium]